MSLRRSARVLTDRMEAHLDQAEHIENTIQRNDRPTAARQIRSFKCELRNTKRKAADMETEVEYRDTVVSLRIARLEETVEMSQIRMEAMQRQLNKTQDQLALTQSKQMELMEMKANLHMGQTAYNFERFLARYIYPPDIVYTKDRIFSNLMVWLQKNQRTRRGREANKRWEDLKQKFKWSPEHEAVFFKMLACRMADAHPRPVDFKLSIPDEFNANERPLVDVIRNMTIKLDDLV